MKEKNINSFWSFNQEQSYEWAFWKNAFTKDECEKIISIGKSFELYKATVFKDEVKKYALDNIRDTNVCFMYPNNETRFIFERLTSIVLELNKKYFNFNLLGFQEGLQFTNYKAPNGRYGKHVDKTSADLLKGSEVDYVSELIGEQFKISNPQTKSSCGCGVSFSL